MRSTKIRSLGRKEAEEIFRTSYMGSTFDAYRGFIEGFEAAAESHHQRIERLRQEVLNLWDAEGRAPATVLQPGDLDPIPGLPMRGER